MNAAQAVSMIYRQQRKGRKKRTESEGIKVMGNGDKQRQKCTQ